MYYESPEKEFDLASKIHGLLVGCFSLHIAQLVVAVTIGPFLEILLP